MHGRFVDDLVRARSAIESARAAVVRWEDYRAEATATAKPSLSKGEGFRASHSQA